ncbi:hypothetical protein BsWGS_25919 [Bradybaena similaris]
MDINPLANPKRVKLLCELCQIPAFIQCKACKVTYYCSLEHQKADAVGIHDKVCSRLAFLRQPAQFWPSKEEREKRYKTMQLEKIELIEMSRTLAQKMLFEGKHEESVPAAMLSLRYAIDVYGVATIELVPSYLIMAEASIGLGNFVQAEEYLAKADWTILKSPDCSMAIRSRLYRNLGLLCVAKGDFQEALVNFADDIYNSSHEFGTDDIRTAGGYFHMANVFFRQGKRDIADSMYKQVINIWYEYLNHVLTTNIVAQDDESRRKSRVLSSAKTLMEEISSGLDEAQEAEAIQILSSIHDIREHQPDRQSKDLAQTCHNLAMLYFLMGDLNKAKEFGRKSIVASDQVKDDKFSKSLVEFMKLCERQVV